MIDVKGYYWTEITRTKKITIIKIFEDGAFTKIGSKKVYSINDYAKNRHIIYKEKINTLSKDLRKYKIGVIK